MRIRHNANSPRRVEIIVPALDELDVSGEVAEQLRAADAHFEVVEQGEKPAGKPAKRPKIR